MSEKEQAAIKIEVRAYPIAEPKGPTVAFASVTINDMIAINGIRIVSGEKSNFVAMPQTKDAKGEYRDIAHPITSQLRKELNNAVLNEYAAVMQKSEKTSVRDQIKDGAKAPDEKSSSEKATVKGKAGKNKPAPDR